MFLVTMALPMRDGWSQVIKPWILRGWAMILALLWFFAGALTLIVPGLNIELSDEASSVTGLVNLYRAVLELGVMIAYSYFAIWYNFLGRQALAPTPSLKMVFTELKSTQDHALAWYPPIC